jgi:hypothetical protein
LLAQALRAENDYFLPKGLLSLLGGGKTNLWLLEKVGGARKA